MPVHLGRGMAATLPEIVFRGETVPQGWLFPRSSCLESIRWRIPRVDRERITPRVRLIPRVYCRSGAGSYLSVTTLAAEHE